MQQASIAIIGGGLSGLYAAFLLEQRGVHDYVLLEARDVFGGRILSASRAGHAAPTMAPEAHRRERFDLGPTWFWPDIQPELDQLLRELDLERFAQHETGDTMVERAGSEPPFRMGGYANTPASMRLANGMEALTDALRRQLAESRIFTGHTVRRLRSLDAHIELDSEDAAGQAVTWRVGHVLLAVPPRLIEDRIVFTPALPQALAEQWRATPTWMAPHAKYIAVFETPFWRDLDLSGQARSARGPMAEIHDASVPGGSAALFGFIGIPAHIRGNLAESVLRSHCRAQLERLFGTRAAVPKAEFIKDWAVDQYTATAADVNGIHDHAVAPLATVAAGPWAGRLTGIASEWSRQFPGYLAGAIDAAGGGVEALPDRLFR